MREAEDAILSGTHPVRISQGSSGSYFVKNMQSVSGLLMDRRTTLDRESRGEGEGGREGSVAKQTILHRISTMSAIMSLSSLPGKHSSVQAQGRGAVWGPEPKVDQVDAQDLLSVLLRAKLPGAQPGLPVGGRGKHRG